MRERAQTPNAAGGLNRTSILTDADLYDRGVATLLASWEAYARGARGAAVWRRPGVAAAVFPDGPERDVYNNAVLARDLGPAERAAALAAMAAAYESACVTSFAAWVHETDGAMRSDLERRGYTALESTRAMGMALDHIRVPRPQIELGRGGWDVCVRILGFPPSLLRGADHSAFHLLVADLDGDAVATAMALDHRGDSGIFNVGTLAQVRRRGLGTALTALQLHDARARGAASASLQSTPMAEGMYASLGFRDLGRFIEYGPPRVRPDPTG